MTLHVEYAGRRIKYGILFIFGLFYEYSNLEYVRIHVISRVNQAEYGTHIRVVAPQKYVNIYSTRRPVTPPVCPVHPVQNVSGQHTQQTQRQRTHTVTGSNSRV